DRSNYSAECDRSRGQRYKIRRLRIRRQRTEIRRHSFMLFALGLFSALLFVLGFSAHAQQLVKALKLGCYMLGAAGLGTREEAFRQGLKDLGYVEGQNIFIEWRFAAGQADQDKRMFEDLSR